jgi:hypothetical protein
MKFDPQKTFPYPVLRPGSDDYVEAEFQSAVQFEFVEGGIVVSCNFATSSVELLNLIEAGYAQFVAIVSCRETYFRKTYRTKGSSISESLDANSLRGEVIAETYIVAIKDIKNYSSPDISPEFGKKRFDFVSGNVLAQAETQLAYIDREAFKPISSVFELARDESLSGGAWKVSLEQDNVQIQVSPEMKEAIDANRSSKEARSVLVNSIYFSAATHMVQAMKDSDDFGDLRWAEILRKQLFNHGLDLTSVDAYYAAQVLMKSPLLLLKNYYFSKGVE